MAAAFRVARSSVSVYRFRDFHAFPGRGHDIERSQIHAKAQVAERRGEFPTPGRVGFDVPIKLNFDCYGVAPSWINALLGTGAGEVNWDSPVSSDVPVSCR